MAVFRAALEQPEEAVAELERAFSEHSARLHTLDVDPKLDALPDARFRRLRNAPVSPESRQRRPSEVAIG